METKKQSQQKQKGGNEIHCNDIKFCDPVIKLLFFLHLILFVLLQLDS